MKTLSQSITNCKRLDSNLMYNWTTVILKWHFEFARHTCSSSDTPIIQSLTFGSFKVLAFTKYNNVKHCVQLYIVPIFVNNGPAAYWHLVSIQNMLRSVDVVWKKRSYILDFRVPFPLNEYKIVDRIFDCRFKTLEIKVV